MKGTGTTMQHGTQMRLAHCCQSRMPEGGIVPPHSVLAPGTALGSLASVALSSAQVDPNDNSRVASLKVLSHGVL
jgi:hypothetical protein